MNQNLLKIGRQLLDIWRQLGLNQRISIVLAACVVFSGLLGLAFWSSRSDYALLYGKLDETEAGKVITALDEAHIRYKVGRSGGAIFVPSDKVHSMRMQLASKGIPSGEGIGFEIFDKPNFGVSDFVQRANYIRAIQGELARTISQVDEVEAARVMIVIPENRLLIDNSKKPTASVFVRLRGTASLPPSSVNSIRFLVANSVEGLQANNVSIVDNRGNVLSENRENDTIAGLTNNQLEARRNLEQYLAKKTEGMLEKVLGPGQAVVRVAADINWESITKTEEKFDPDGKVERMTTTTDENTESLNGSANGGVPGASSNSNFDTNRLAGVPQNNTHTKKKVTNSEFQISKTTSNIIQSAGGIKRLSAAVFVASKFEGTGSQRKAVKRPPDEIQKLQHLVESALGIQQNPGVQPNNTTRQDQITLEEISFNEQPFVDMTQNLEKQEKQQFWWEMAKNVAYPALALGILAAFWRSFKRTSSADIPIGIPLGPLHANGNGNGNGNGHANGHSNGNGNGNGNGKSNGFRPPAWIPEPAANVVTVDVLNQLIRENPDNVTQAVRNWLTRGNSDRRS